MRLFCAFAVCVLCVFLVHGLALISLIQIMSAVPSSSSYHIAHTQLFYLSFFLSFSNCQSKLISTKIARVIFFLFCIVGFCPLVADIWVSIDKKIVIWFIHDCALAFQPLWAFIRYGFSFAMAFHLLWLFNRFDFSTAMALQPFH